jgi:hypothetical protein
MIPKVSTPATLILFTLAYIPLSLLHARNHRKYFLARFNNLEIVNGDCVSKVISNFNVTFNAIPSATSRLSAREIQGDFIGINS